MQDKIRRTGDPLAIPEILSAVGVYLRRSAIVTSCLCVSRHWHRILIPLVWGDLCLWFDRDNSTDNGPSLLSLQKHAPLVQKLRIWYTFSLEFPHGGEDNQGRNDDGETGFDGTLYFPNLTMLGLQQLPTHDEMHVEECIHVNVSLCKFLRRHQDTLENVSLEKEATVEVLRVLQEGWVGGHSSLTRIPATSLQSLSWNSQQGNRIEELLLQRIHKSLYPIQRWIVEQSPRLVRLALSIELQGTGDEDLRPMLDLAKMMQSGWSCQELEELTIPCLKFQNEDFTVLINSTRRPLKKLDLWGSNFDLVSWRSLQQQATAVKSPSHLAQLRVLNLRDCVHLPGSAIQEILCCMQNLEDFKTEEITDQEILNDNRPWVCLGLRTLMFRVKIVSDWETSNTMISARISTLSKLKSLTIFPPRDGEEHNTFRLLLQGGLDQLRTEIGKQ
ncbi:hypothetical protein BGZ83_007096 [Gryganskiella cystojenkinii]|nr:hypothetical protein BGZ83_007096 [Gryganskiella cystojenkinii]